MHLNYYFIRRLTKSLSKEIIGSELIEAFSQNKDELILSFLSGKKEFYIKSLLSTQFACLSFSTEFARARKNSIDLFESIRGLKVNDVYQFLNERSFSIQFENNFQLLFKMHGKRSNILLFQGNNLISLFNSQMKFDLDLDLKKLDRPIDQGFENFKSKGLEIFPTFDKTIKIYLNSLGYSHCNSQEDYQLIQDVLTKLEGPIVVYKAINDGLPILTLLNNQITSDYIKRFTNPLDASNEYYYQYTKIYTLSKEKGEVSRSLLKKIKQTENYLTKSYNKLEDIEKNARHQETGDIIMANLHQISPMQKEVTLFDFYKNQDIKIKLKKELTPQKNAETYYRKAKNQKIEVEKLYENLQKKEEEISKYQLLKEQINAIESLKELRKFLKLNGLIKSLKPKEETEPFKKVKLNDWVILIGRNAKSNDELTQRTAHKNDLWLHAKDVSGSHVIIKNISGKEFPKNIIEKAAQFAAFYSKRKTDSLCPVIFTPKKYVRKTKGMLPGQVIVDREEVILVKPESLQNIT